MFKVTCGKCNGKGNLKMYNHISGGTCFACKGKGNIEYKTDPAVRKANKQAVKEAKAVEIAEKIKKYEQKVFAFIEDQKENQDFIRRMGDFDPYERGFELAQDVMNYYESKNMWNYENSSEDRGGMIALFLR